MEIKRIDTYTDPRFSRKALLQHGCFLVDEAPFEIEILSDFEAVIRGQNEAAYLETIEEFRFYTPHITKFYNERRQIIREYPKARLLSIYLDQIQPSQFYVDKEKLEAISTFIHKPDDIIIQVMPYKKKYLSLDGHTRLYYAACKGWNTVQAVEAVSDDNIYGFAEEAKRKNIFSPKAMILVNHDEYEEKWNRFCDEYFSLLSHRQAMDKDDAVSKNFL